MKHRLAISNDYSRLIEVWERSVRATHTFLVEKDIQEIKAQLPMYFEAVNLLIWEDDNQLIGFSGTHHGNLEMLFLDDKFRGQGFGRKIIQYLIENSNVISVDVNEDNPDAFKFYQAVGFEQVGRSELDDAGRPFPIIHMKLRE